MWRPFRRKPKQVVGEREVTVNEELVASILEAQRLSRPRRRRRFICYGTNVREELRKIMENEKKSHSD